MSRALASGVVRVVRIATIAAAVLVLTFFGLTRTQVGRDQLRSEVERQFRAQFKGEIRIGALKGNLVNDLYASDVRLLDPAGEVVASVDSVVLRPRWQDLLRREISIGSITLYRPTFQLIRRADGSWNALHALERRVASSTIPDSNAIPWRINSTEIRIIDGAVTTVNRGTVPEAVTARKVFDYTSTQLRDLDASATVVWRPDDRRVAISRLSGDWTSLGLPIHLIQGEIALRADAVDLGKFELRAGESTISLSGGLAALEALKERRPEALAVDLDFRKSRIGSADVRRFLPSLPIADGLDLEGRLSGTIGALAVEGLRLERGQSRVLAEGKLRGLPDSLYYDLRLLPSTIAVRDVQALWPQAPVRDYRHLGIVRVDLTSQGALTFADSGASAFRFASSVFAVRTNAGTAAGKASLNHGAGALAYTANVRVNDLNVGGLLNKPALTSRIDGTVLLAGRGVPAKTGNARVRMEITGSSLAGRALDTLSVAADLRGRLVSGTAHFSQGEGSVDAIGSVDLSRAIPAYDLDLAFRRTDLGGLLLSDTLHTAITGRATLAGQGISLADLGGQLDLALDSSLVHYGPRTSIIPPHRNVIEIGHPSMGVPYVLLEGDIATVRLDGDIALAPLLSLARLWGTATARTLKQELDKPYAPYGGLENAGTTLVNDPVEMEADDRQRHAMREAARASLAEAGFEEGLSTTATFELHRPDILAALLPTLPPLEADVKSELEFSGDADSLAVSGEIYATAIRAGSIRTGAFRTKIEATGTLDQPLDRTLSVTLDVSADSLHVPGYDAAHPTLVLHYRQRSGEVSFTTRGGKNTGPVQLAATLDLLPDRNRLTLYNLRLSAGTYQWTTTEDYPIDVYSDALVIPGLTLQSWISDSGLPQRVRLHGTLSSAPIDTLFAEVENISLRQISALAKLKNPVHGLLHGQLALAGGLASPELTGRVDVPMIVFGNQVLGQLSARSQYIPGSPEVALDVSLRPVESVGPRSDAEAEELPRGVLALKRNDVHVGGTFRLPEISTDGMADPGRLDLTVDVARGDLFFVENIFPTLLAGVEGYASGGGSITGSFRRPVPDLNLEVHDGKFRVPEFQLSYTASGPVKIDARGLTIDGAVVRDNTGGSARLSGGLRFNDYEYLSLDLQGDLESLQIMNVMQSRTLAFYGRIWASGRAYLTGRLEDALLRSSNAVVNPRSEVFIPVLETAEAVDPGFIIFADSTGRVPDLAEIAQERTTNGTKVRLKRNFVEGLGMDLNLLAQEGTTVHLVIDPLLGDMINAVGNGRIQLQLREGEFLVYGELDVNSGDYLFTAGDVFARRFLINEGRLAWNGDPLNPELDIRAAYRTRANLDGLEVNEQSGQTVPLLVLLNVTGPMYTPEIGLGLALDDRSQDLVVTGSKASLEAAMNDPARATEYATSVLLTNSFLLTTQDARSQAGSTTTSLAFNSVSQLVMSQLNRYIGAALPNLDVNFGFQGERVEDLDVTFGLALHLLNDKLVISSSGVVRGQDQGERYQGEFVVALKLSRNLSAEVFYRKEDDLAFTGGGGAGSGTTTNTAGAGLSYETEFSSWGRLKQWLFGGSAPDTTAVPSGERPEALPPEERTTAGLD